LRDGERGANTPTYQVRQRSGRVHHGRRMRDDSPLASGKCQRASQVICEQRGQAGQSVVTGRADSNRTTAEQALPDLRQPRPCVVVPADRQRPARQIDRSLWGTGQDSGMAEGRGQCLGVVRGQLHVSVHIDARISLSGFVTRVEGCALGCHGQRNDAHSRTEGGRHGSGVVAAAVGDNDYVQVSSSIRGYKPPEQASDDAGLVVRRHDHADHGHGMPRRPGLMRPRASPALAGRD
jgi:hypothetical protein